HRKALGLSIALAASMALAQPISGDAIAQMVAHWQPIKLAALEAHFDTTTGAAISIGGIVDQEHGKIDHAIKIPYMLSFLAFHDPSARVAGLNQFPRDEWPNVMLVHCFFQVMVGCGGIMSLVSLWAIIEFVR